MRILAFQTSPMTLLNDPNDFLLVIGTDDTIAPIYNEKYRVILSNNDTVYLDHGYGRKYLIKLSAEQ